MKLIKSKKALVLLALAVAAVAAVGAYAYFSSTGTGTGSATVGSSTAFVVTEGAHTNPAHGLQPDAALGGANIESNAYTVNNPSAGNQKLNQVVISVAGTAGDGSATTWSAQADNTKPPCTASDFSVGGQLVGQPWTDTSQAGDLTPGQTVSSSVTVELIDNGLNQDNCQGVTVPLHYAAS